MQRQRYLNILLLGIECTLAYLVRPVCALPIPLRVPCDILQRARGHCGFSRCTMAEGGGPESGNASDPDEKPVITQTPVPSTENQKQSIGTLLKTPLRKGDEW